jgi:hypothetical protein
MADQQDKSGPPDQDPTGENEGEGSRSAAHRYNEGVRKTVEGGKVAEKADAARKATEGPEGEELRRAEKQAKERGNQAGSEQKK